MRKVSDQGESPGEFSRQPLLLGLDFHPISIFCLHRALYKITPWKFFVYGKIFARRKIKTGRKRKQAIRRKTGYQSVKKRNTFLCESNWYWRSSTLASRFWAKKSLSNQNFPYLKVVVVSSSSTLHWVIEIKKKYVAVMGYFSREILIHRHRRQEVLLSHWDIGILGGIQPLWANL